MASLSGTADVLPLVSFHVALNTVQSEKILFTYRTFPKVFA